MVNKDVYYGPIFKRISKYEVSFERFLSVPFDLISFVLLIVVHIMSAW